MTVTVSVPSLQIRAQNPLTTLVQPQNHDHASAAHASAAPALWSKAQLRFAALLCANAHLQLQSVLALQHGWCCFAAAAQKTLGSSSVPHSAQLRLRRAAPVSHGVLRWSEGAQPQM